TCICDILQHQFSPVILIFKVLQREICDYLFNPEPANLLFAISRTTLHIAIDGLSRIRNPLDLTEM
ncbi:MAG: hypothetical protein RIC03_04165, partial [Cyclobacteriaceae bacterium]